MSKEKYNSFGMKKFYLKQIVAYIMLGYSASAHACQNYPGPLTIQVEGGNQSPTNQNYYVVQAPDSGDRAVQITITAGGSTSCPPNCKCNSEQQEPTEERQEFTIDHDAGSYNGADHSSLTWSIDQNVAPGRYTFQVIELDTSYKDCPSDWTGGAPYQSNTYASPLITILVCKINHETVSTVVPDRSRNIIGGGEAIMYTFLPTDQQVWWSFESDAGGSAYNSSDVNDQLTMGSTNSTAGKGLPSWSSNTFTYKAGTIAGKVTVCANALGVPNKKTTPIVMPATITYTRKLAFRDTGEGKCSGGSNGIVNLHCELKFEAKDKAEVDFSNLQYAELGEKPDRKTGWFDHYDMYHDPDSNRKGSRFVNIKPGNTYFDNAGLNAEKTSYPFVGDSQVNWTIPIQIKSPDDPEEVAVTICRVTQSLNMTDTKGRIFSHKEDQVYPDPPAKFPTPKPPGGPKHP